MGKRTKVISIACLLFALPSGALAEGNPAQTPQLIKVETGQKSAMNPAFIGALASDISGPAIESATASPISVGVGDIITITAIASDESGVAEVIAYLNLPTGGYKVIPLALDGETGEWKGTYTITDIDPEGTWNIDFDLFDTLGNQSYGDPINPVQVVNPNGDIAFPTLESVVISPLQVGVDEEFTIRAKVNDDKGVDNVNAAIKTADSVGYYYLPLTFNESTNEWVLTHKFSSNDIGGSWFIEIDMQDKAGNFDWEVLDEELFLTNPFADFKEATIGAAVITPTSASPGDSVHLSVPVMDESGVSSVYAEFSHIDSPYDYHIRHLTLNPETGEWEGDLLIESNFQSGVWNVVIHSTDNVGNRGLKEISGAFNVTNNDGDFDPPVISNIQVTQGEVQVGDTVTVTANVTDNVAVDSVLATLYSQGGSNEYITMTYDEVSQLWTGGFVVQETTAPGFYQASISTYDTSFNLDFADAAGGFTVINPEGDYTGPVVSDVVFDKTEVNAGEQITISASVEDAESGVASVTANYYENETIDLTYDSIQDKWVGTITVPTIVPDGEVVNINFIDAVDQSGNQTVKFIDAVSFLVHNPDGDFTAPIVENFEMTPTTVKPGETVHFEAKIVDDKSGVKSATVDLFNDSNPELTSIDLTYDEINDVWTADYVIPANAVLGSYSVSLEVEDNTENEAINLQTQTLRLVSEDTDITAPVAPTVDAVNDNTTEVTGTTEADAEVTVKVGETVIGSGIADGEGKFTITIERQTAGTTIIVTAKDAFDNISEGVSVTVIDQTPPAAPTVSVVTDQDSTLTGTTEANAEVIVNVGETLIGSGKADETGKFSITIAKQKAGTQIAVIAKDKAENSSTSKIVVEAGYSPIKIQLNGKDFGSGGYYRINTTYVNWNALKTLNIPHSNEGNGVFLIEGRSVQGVEINGDWYIEWKQLPTLGKLTWQKIEGGYNFIYAAPIKLQLNGKDFSFGGYYRINTTLVNWNALKTLKIPYSYQGKGVFLIGGRTVQAEGINNDWYIDYKELSPPGKITWQKIEGGYNFIYAAPIKIQLNGEDFALGGYYRINTTLVNWNALKTLKIPFSYQGKGVFVINGRTVQAEGINNDWFIDWKQLSPPKITFQKIDGGGYNFIYNP